ncbi:glycosyltransferase [Chloroflexus sp.]|uniref:glycosyltransferase n=2 Tax=Chloroflexus TaxID=1107 RepID=UPI002FDB2C7D
MTDKIGHSTFASPTGYSSSSRAIVAALSDAGMAVRPFYLFDADAAERAYGVVPPAIRALQRLPIRLDVPQVVYGRGELFCRPIHVIPLGVDLTVFTPGSPRTELIDRTIFLSVFEWSRRKGWDVLLTAYRAAFQPRDPVVLVLKIDHRADGNPLRELAAILDEHAPPVAVLYNQTLTAARMAELYRSVDCFVLPSRGEGWGMPALEAMACGTPVIATDWSGLTEFLDETCGYPLPIRGLTPTGMASGPYAGAQWAEPDSDALVELLRRVHQRREEARALGAQAARRAQNWTWTRSAQTICDRLRAIGV